MLQAPLIIWFSEQKNAKSETIARNSSDGLKPADFLRDYIKKEIRQENVPAKTILHNALDSKPSFYGFYIIL